MRSEVLFYCSRLLHQEMILNNALSTQSISGCVSSDVVKALQLVERLHARQAMLLPGLAVAAHVLMVKEGWKEFGFANSQDFSRERLDHSGRWLRNLATLADSFSQLPMLRNAVTGLDGKRPLGSAAAYEVARVATAGTAEHWVARA